LNPFLFGCQPSERAPKLQLQPGPAATMRIAADRVLADFPRPPDFNWGEGVLMVGMVRAGRAVQDERYLNFVRTWAEHWRTAGLQPVLQQRGYCGHWGPAFAVLELYGVMNEERYLTMAHDVASFLLREGTRTSDGGLGHWRGNHQLWVDTLYMVCPLLAELGEVMDRDEFQAEAARQLLIFASHLQDDQTGLFYHMYDEPQQTRTDAFWGRGNGWTAMSLVEVLARLDPDASDRPKLAATLVRQAEGLRTTWDAGTGLWHTVLDRHDSYIETSASAMILYSLLRAERLGMIEPLDPGFVGASWGALADQVDADGRVINVSTGTGPTTYEKYIAIERGTYTWGTGAFLMAAAELYEVISD
jgi:unsaturated rhamnogalacturonyl hydrolase